MCNDCGTNKKPFNNGNCSVCGGFGLQEFCLATTQEGTKILFAPTDTIKLIDKNLRMSKLLSEIGIFESVSEADRNGWKNKFIPTGWSDIIVGKRPKMKRVCIWNPTEDYFGV